MELQNGEGGTGSMIPLSELAVNVPAVIRTVLRTETDLTDNLYALGAVEGTPIEITRRGFYGSPIIVRIKRSHVAMRIKEASLIMVEKSSNTML